MEVTKENRTTLEFLDLMTHIETFSEVRKENRLKSRLDYYFKNNDIDFNLAKKYVSNCPLRTYKNMYNLGTMEYLF